MVEGGIIEGPKESSTDTVGQIKRGKAGGPKQLAHQIIRAAGQAEVKKMRKISDMVMYEGKVVMD